MIAPELSRVGLDHFKAERAARRSRASLMRYLTGDAEVRAWLTFQYWATANGDPEAANRLSAHEFRRRWVAPFKHCGELADEILRGLR